MSGEQTRKLVVLAVIWLALLLAPYWMAPLGGYTALATRVLVLGLAAMSVNFLLGFTGVLSFGHAAYFAMVTIAFGQVFYYIAFQWSSLTGGDDGLRGFSRQPLDFGWFQIDILSDADYFYY